MKPFLSDVMVMRKDVSQLELLDTASLLVSLTNSANLYMAHTLEGQVESANNIVADVNRLIALNIELAEQFIDVSNSMTSQHHN